MCHKDTKLQGQSGALECENYLAMAFAFRTSKAVELVSPKRCADFMNIYSAGSCSLDRSERAQVELMRNKSTLVKAIKRVPVCGECCSVHPTLGG